MLLDAQQPGTRHDPGQDGGDEPSDAPHPFVYGTPTRAATRLADHAPCISPILRARVATHEVSPFVLQDASPASIQHGFEPLSTPPANSQLITLDGLPSAPSDSSLPPGSIVLSYCYPTSEDAPRNEDSSRSPLTTQSNIGIPKSELDGALSANMGWLASRDDLSLMSTSEDASVVNPSAQNSDKQGELRGLSHPPKRMRFLCPASIWPEHMCEEYGGTGWEIEIIKCTGLASLCAFVFAVDVSGRRYPSVWLKNAVLQPLPAPRSAKPSILAAEENLDHMEQPPQLRPSTTSPLSADGKVEQFDLMSADGSTATALEALDKLSNEFLFPAGVPQEALGAAKEDTLPFAANMIVVVKLRGVNPDSCQPSIVPALPEGTAPMQTATNGLDLHIASDSSTCSKNVAFGLSTTHCSKAAAAQLVVVQETSESKPELMLGHQSDLKPHLKSHLKPGRLLEPNPTRKPQLQQPSEASTCKTSLCRHESGDAVPPGWSQSPPRKRASAQAARLRMKRVLEEDQDDDSSPSPPRKGQRRAPVGRRSPVRQRGIKFLAAPRPNSQSSLMGRGPAPKPASLKTASEGEASLASPLMTTDDLPGYEDLIFRGLTDPELLIDIGDMFCTDGSFLVSRSSGPDDLASLDLSFDEDVGKKKEFQLAKEETVAEPIVAAANDGPRKVPSSPIVLEKAWRMDIAYSPLAAAGLVDRNIETAKV